MSTTLTNPPERGVNSAEGPRLKKWTIDEYHAIEDCGVIDRQPLELIDGDILARHSDYYPLRRRWTRDEVNRLGDSGAIDVEHLELIDGELYDKMGKNTSHSNAQQTLLMIMFGIFGGVRVSQERSIDMTTEERHVNEPMPDLVVLNRNLWPPSATPRPHDVSLLVEVSDTTLRFDLGSKADLYAQAGIGEYWVMDVKKRRLIVHREAASGHYSSVVTYDAHQSVAPLAAPGQMVPVANLFPAI